ncbi:DUF4352 domain-containing protein [Nocardioides sp. Soil796]|uniref:DUF4352 domain-containing protein n=1 Tax=Nocardioides sp. Soil796 TaxID=1736412 RepID=UPI00070A15E8|nr:DUF4352 domain-containing protein [Nocardioides sp. Soil796]KRF16849.1 hypothetical protein ASH02_01955 [Nocardioides sp. Soil796]
MRTVAYRSLFGFVTAGLLVLTGCDDAQERTLEEAESTLKEYLVALSNGDSDACDLETSSYADELEETFEESDCDDRVDLIKGFYEAFEVELFGAKYKATEGSNDDETVVSVTYRDGDGGDTFRLVYDDDHWLVDGEVDGGDDDSASSSEEDDASEEAAPVVLPLTAGSSLSLPGNADGVTSDEATFTVAFDTLTCDTRIRGASYDKNYEEADFVADEGNQICIVELAATNDSKIPATFSSEYDANIHTLDGTEYSPRSDDFNDQGYLAGKDREPSYTADNVQPGETKYDVIAYELPADAEPIELVYSAESYE